MCQAPSIPPCLHCERAPRSLAAGVRHLRLCNDCGAVKGLRRIYRKRPGWTAAWDAHLQRLVEQARLGLPVVVDQPGYTIPNPPDNRQRRRGRRPRVYRVHLEK